MSGFYVTTPLYYVNDRPHIGHAYTTIAADVLARWNRMQGNSTHFLTGTDEHGQKVYRVSVKRGLSPKDHVDEMVVPFQKLWDRLNIQYDDFIRTTETRHTSVVQALLQKLFEEGDIYEHQYVGWYSTSAERFWTEKDLVDGKCPESGLEVEWTEEKNYFFKMSKYEQKIRQWIEDHPQSIQPEYRKNEILGYLNSKEIGDLCISRPLERLPWGIPLPFDEQFVTYVWFDALLNYVTAIGFHPDSSKQANSFTEHWPASVQLLGKDILTTHTIYWWSILFAAGLTPPNQIYAHGWWTIENQKMSKSIGNVVDPNLLIDSFGVDPVRFFLMREIPFGGDGNFSFERFKTRYNDDLANDLGNLLHRTLSMTTKWLGAHIPKLDSPQENDLELDQIAIESAQKITTSMENVQVHSAIEALWPLIRAGNRYIDKEQPWRLNREGNTERLAGVMRRCLEVCRIAAWQLSPFMPEKSRLLLNKLHSSEPTNLNSLNGLQEGAALEVGDPLFPQIKELPEQIKKILGIEDAPAKTPEKNKEPGMRRIKSKVFKRVPFCSGRIVRATTNDSGTILEVNIGEETVTIEGDALNQKPQDLLGTDVVVSRPNSNEDFQKIILKSGQIKKAQAHPNADSLLWFQIDIGEADLRSVCAGIASKYDPKDLLNQRVCLVANLKPSKLRDIVSDGMIMAAGGEQLQSICSWPETVSVGTTAVLFGSAPTALVSFKNTDGSLQLLELSEPTIPGSIVR